jgi:hypothetical protein
MEAPTPGQSNAQLGLYESPNGKVRLWYRTTVNSVDQFERAFLSYERADENRVRIGARALARFCLDRFAVKVGILGEDGAWMEKPFSWVLLEELKGAYAEGGWPAEAAATIWQKVVEPHDTELEALKKTSLSASGSSTSEGPAKPERASPIST